MLLAKQPRRNFYWLHSCGSHFSEPIDIHCVIGVIFRVQFSASVIYSLFFELFYNVSGPKKCVDASGTEYGQGESWSPDPCTDCTCEVDEKSGRKEEFCATADCASPVDCPYDLITPPDQCCPICKSHFCFIFSLILCSLSLHSELISPVKMCWISKNAEFLINAKISNEMVSGFYLAVGETTMSKFLSVTLLSCAF